MFPMKVDLLNASDKVSMIAILTDLQTQLDGHAKVNQEKCLEIETLKNELLQCKQEIYRLDTKRSELDLENKNLTCPNTTLFPMLSKKPKAQTTAEILHKAAPEELFVNRRIGVATCHESRD
ncbi:hypothetical protein Tco_0262264 [Tanacetum coccineum]